MNFLGSEDFQVRNGLVVANGVLVVNSASGTVGVNTSNSSITLNINTTDAIKVPIGTTAQRPAAANGLIRFNSDLKTLEYASSASWNPLAGQPFNCGRLQIIQPPGDGAAVNNFISFVPYNGNYIKVNGSVYQIPSAGIVADSRNCFINGVANQSFPAPGLTPWGANASYWNTTGTQVDTNNLVYVYVFNNNGTPALDFCNTGHSTSTTTRNIGTEIKTGDDTRTLVGMLWPVNQPNGAFNQFIYSGGVPVQCNMANWFNRQVIGLNTNAVNLVTIDDSSWHTWAQNYGLLRGDDLSIEETLFGYIGAGGTTIVSSILADINAQQLRSLPVVFPWTAGQYAGAMTYFAIGSSFQFTDYTKTVLKEGINGFSGLYITSSGGAFGFVLSLGVSYRA